MFEDRHQLATPSGANLAYHSLAAKGHPRAIVLICHGLAEHSCRYGHFAEELADHGYHVYAHDHRGHGETQAPDASLGRFGRKGGWRLVIEDVMAMRTLALSQHPGLPVILFGHSMGGLISLNTAISHPTAFDAVAVWNSNFHPGIAGRVAQAVLGIERVMKGSDVPSGLLPKATFNAWGKAIPGYRTGFDWLSHDSHEVDAYIADPLCGFDASVSLWEDIFALTYRGQDQRKLARLPLTLPINLVGGGEDPATDYGKAVTWFGEHLTSLGFGRTTTTVYPQMRHETLNEVDKATAIEDFIRWAKSAV
ncbi:alpha/beta hydrolase [Peteryoungia desertarenae]|uniref:Alpha/beta hydrolase n=1 Tax=Peteryoungia desertarenae TaxID=1813451 RepID=A0ABX6QQT7_9HYPH|nr:alpha/beta hydrolase [Peteryoungia desertarenae]QLF70873.1 alpha/beta hydrolase [Peteryoungia desertarenae]